MKQSEKPAFIAGAFVMAFSAIILISLIIQLLDFGVVSGAFALALSNFGAMLYSVYGLSAFLIPAYLFVAAIMLYLPDFTFRRGIYLLFSIIPFFTVVGIEKFSKSLFTGNSAAYQLMKYSAVVLVSVLLIAIEYLVIGIIVDSLTGKRAVAGNAAYRPAARQPVSQPVAGQPASGPVQKGVIEGTGDHAAGHASIIEDIPELPYAIEDLEAVEDEPEDQAAAPAEPVDPDAVKEKVQKMAMKTPLVHRAEVETTASKINDFNKEEGQDTPITVVFGAAPELTIPASEEPVVVPTEDVALSAFDDPAPAVEAAPAQVAAAAVCQPTAVTAPEASGVPEQFEAPAFEDVAYAPEAPVAVAPATPVDQPAAPAAAPLADEPAAPAVEEPAPAAPAALAAAEAAPLADEPAAPAAAAPSPVFDASDDDVLSTVIEDTRPEPIHLTPTAGAVREASAPAAASVPAPAAEPASVPVEAADQPDDVPAAAPAAPLDDMPLKVEETDLYSEEEAAFFDDPFEEKSDEDIIEGDDALMEGLDKIPFEVAPAKGAYSVPTEGILNNFENNPYWIIDDETKQAGAILKETLSEFKIEAEVTGIRKGPVVTMFEILPAPGVKLTRIVALQDNIALRLAASSVRIVAPIPGKQAVGVEVPNRQRAMVSFRELIEKELPVYEKMQIPVVLGKDITGDAQVIDLSATPHLLIAGSTGSGKSVCVNSMILSILYKRSPNDVKLILIDPKIVELKLYNDIPHLLTPVITEPKKAFQALQYCLCEMERRYAMLDHMGVRDIKSYNRRIAERKVMQEKLPYIVVVIDEFADLMATTGKELESTIARLAAMSRAVGIHLVLATQRPSIDVITGLIKANIPTRIAFMVASKTDSRIIIDQVGAEKLLGKGDMLYASAIDPFPVRIQGTFVTDDEVENVVEYVKKYGAPDYIDDEIFVEDEDDEDAEPALFSDGEDPLYDRALEIVVQAGKASASYIQRRLKIGYNRAARLVEEMEERGIVGPQNGSKPREIIHIP